MVTAMNKVRALLFIAVWVAIWGMWKQHERIGELNTKNAKLLTEQVKINEDYQERVQTLRQLDTKHIQELASAKIEIDKLRIAAERNPEQVYIRASCKKLKALPPQAWMMEQPLDLLTPLSEIIGYSETELQN
ncbi:Bacteriophage lysis protein [Providencia heimbachae]|nr:Bacteriophage lysis protein [Providencia heimbachae]